jgi:hypothetical protein
MADFSFINALTNLSYSIDFQLIQFYAKVLSLNGYKAEPSP